MTPDDKRLEPRLFYVMREDLALSPGRLAALVMKATVTGLMSARNAHADAYASYHGPQVPQPKIIKRARGETMFLRAVEAAQTACLPYTVVDLDQTPALLVVGPTCLDTLPNLLQKMQLASLNAPEKPAYTLSPPASGPCLTLAVRGDLAIPYGKLAAQAGHAAWRTLVDAQDAQAAFLAAGCPIAARIVADTEALQQFCQQAPGTAAFITDAGRTVFEGRPTPTVAGAWAPLSWAMEQGQAWLF